MNGFGRTGQVFLKTYGKHTRKVQRWLSPDTRKLAFASTSSSDLSIGEPSRIPRLKRNKKVSVANARPARAAKKKAMDGLLDWDSDEEDVSEPAPLPKLGPARKRTSGVKAVVKRKRPVSVSTSESDEERTAKSRMSSCGSGATGSSLKAGNSAVRPSYQDRYVTHRRRGPPEKRRGPPERTRASKPRCTAQKPRVSIGDGSWNSSDDFVKGLMFAQRSRRGQPPKRALLSANSSSDQLTSPAPAPALRRPRGILKEVSLNSTADRPASGSGYKKPLLSSTPSLSYRAAYRHLEPSISEISCDMDESRGAPPRAGGDASPGRRALRVLAESGEENLPPPEGETVGLSVSNGDGEAPQESVELFSRADCESGVQDGPGGPRDVPSQEDLSVQFLSAQSHLRSLVAASVQARGTPVVVLERADLSGHPSVRRGAGAGGEETYSSCVDSESALRGGSEGSPGEEEKEGAGLRAGERERSASVLWISSSPPGEDGGAGRPGEAEDCGALAEADRSSAEPDSGRSVSLDEPSRDLFLDPSEVEPAGRSGEDRTASLLAEGGALNTGPLPPPSVRARLKERCRLVQPAVLLRRLDLTQCIVGYGTLRMRGSGSAGAPQREARSSGSGQRSDPQGRPETRETSPLSGDPPGRSESSPERPGAANGKPDGGRLSAGGLRRRLSSAFVSAGLALSPPGLKRGPGRHRNQAAAAAAPPKPGTGRKACVSGLSVSRWAKKDPHRQRPKNSSAQSNLSGAVDCSLLDFQRGRDARKQPDAGSSLFQAPSSMVLGTPQRMEPLNISSLLADFTPGALTTHTWSRLKAALSVHKKKRAFFTPQRLRLSQTDLHGDGSLDGSVPLLYSPTRTPLSPHQQASRLSATTATPLGASLLSEDITDAEKLYQECQQDGPVPFERCLPPHRMKLCKKVGEGTFGEVFTTTAGDSNQTVALKIVPIEGKQKVNGEDQKSFGEILHEVIISKELSSLDDKEVNQTTGFIGLNNLHCVRGRYPKLLLSAWDKFDKQRGSENDRPDFFEEDQLFLILEFEFGGSDLEAMNGKLPSLVVAKSILHQVTAALAVAEQALCFEHRDLHWGNILVKNTKEKSGTYVLNGTLHTVETKGVHVNIIDYSLSRLEIDGLTVSCDISADEALFMGQGDYQFDIYRRMREENNNSWSEFNPHSNVLWLHYLADKLLCMGLRGSKGRAETRPARELRRSIEEFHSGVLAYASARAVLEGCRLFRDA